MSRVGRKPVAIPSGVQVKIEGQEIHVKGPRGQLSRSIDSRVKLLVKDGQVQVEREQDDRLIRSLHGLIRSNINNMMIGVSQGYQKILEINGVGFRAQLQGKSLQLNLGFSHPVVFPLPSGIDAKVEKQNVITIQGVDKQQVGQVAADLKAIKPPEPYKGKGIKYAGEVIHRKEGKTGK
jgi:large subunit ribosomal protein L6